MSKSIAYKLFRIFRRPKTLEDFMDLHEKQGKKEFVLVYGSYYDEDLSGEFLGHLSQPGVDYHGVVGVRIGDKNKELYKCHIHRRTLLSMGIGDAEVEMACTTKLIEITQTLQQRGFQVYVAKNPQSEEIELVSDTIINGWRNEIGKYQRDIDRVFQEYVRRNEVTKTEIMNRRSDGLKG